jgi:hypothetical protein
LRDFINEIVPLLLNDVRFLSDDINGIFLLILYSVRLLPAATETRLLQDLQGSKDATPKRGRARAKLDNEVLNERLPSLPSVLLFHPSAPHLVVCEKAYVR